MIIKLLKEVAINIFYGFAWLILMLLSPLWILHELIVVWQMNKARRDYENSDYYKSLNHDPSIPCTKCGRTPDLWEEAFPHKICESCYEIWLDELDKLPEVQVPPTVRSSRDANGESEE